MIFENHFNKFFEFFKKFISSRPNRNRTDDLLLVRQPLYQLSYWPAQLSLTAPLCARRVPHRGAVAYLPQEGKGTQGGSTLAFRRKASKVSGKVVLQEKLARAFTVSGTLGLRA